MNRVNVVAVQASHDNFGSPQVPAVELLDIGEVGRQSVVVPDGQATCCLLYTSDAADE